MFFQVSSVFGKTIKFVNLNFSQTLELINQLFFVKSIVKYNTFKNLSHTK